MILFKNITKIYKKTNGEEIFALKDVSFEIKENEFVILAGKSGAGKTTILKLIIAEEKPTLGEIYFENTKINDLPPDKISQLRQKIGIVFQDYKLLKTKTAKENLSYVLEITNEKEEKIKTKIKNLLAFVGLEKRENNFPEELSAGEKQKLAIARALALSPKIILADEPTANLDPICTLEILRLFLKLHQMGNTILLATHNENVIKFLKKRIIILEEGKIIRDDKNGRFII
jgi:cell division transport system ATP-binding protein